MISNKQNVENEVFKVYAPGNKSNRKNQAENRTY